MRFLGFACTASQAEGQSTEANHSCTDGTEHGGVSTGCGQAATLGPTGNFCDHTGWLDFGLLGSLRSLSTTFDGCAVTSDNVAIFVDRQCDVIEVVTALVRDTDIHGVFEDVRATQSVTDAK